VRKILGVDENQNILAFVTKKEKLINLSNMKISARRNKEVQIMENEVERQFDNEIQKCKDKINKDMEGRMINRKKELETMYRNRKIEIDK
jgi:Leu/Phe-tRNA-protein transferase